MKAGIYVRISKDLAGESLGVARQEEDCRTLAEQQGWQVVEVYVDNDASATRGPRPAYDRLLADMAAGRIAALVAWHPDRLYRRVTDLGDLVDACKAGGTQIATVNAGHIDLTTPTGRLVAGLLAQVATYEVEHKTERWSRAWRQGRELGEFPRTGSRLWGYTREGQLVPEEAELARGWVRTVLAGGSIQGIARALLADGVRTTRDSDWRTGTLRQYLLNPRIAGYSTLNREIVGEGRWEPIVDKETFADLQALLRARARPYVGRKYLLNGLAFCHLCGTRMISGSQGRGQASYRCVSRPGINGCGKVSIKLEPVDEIVEAYARNRLADPRVRAALEALTNDTTGPQQREIVELSSRITELEAELDKPGTPVAALTRAIARAEERSAELRQQLTLVRRPSPTLPVGDHWPTDLHERRALIDLVVAEVKIRRADPRRGSRTPFDVSRVVVTPR